MGRRLRSVPAKHLLVHNGIGDKVLILVIIAIVNPAVSIRNVAVSDRPLSQRVSQSVDSVSNVGLDEERTRDFLLRRDKEVSLVSCVVDPPLLDELSQGVVDRVPHVPVRSRPLGCYQIAEDLHVCSLAVLLQSAKYKEGNLKLIKIRK